MTYKTQAIVLKTYVWPRNARLFVLYTQKFGKIKGVAAGVDKIKSKVAGHLQPFCITEVMMAQGRNIDRLAQARYLYGHPGISQEFSLYTRGSYILEVVDALTKEGVADEVIWNNLMAVFNELGQQGEWQDDNLSSHDLLIRIFALQLLDRMGFRPELYNCIYCRDSLKPAGLHFSVLQGGTVCSKCRASHEDCLPVNVELVKFFRAVISKPLVDVTRIIVKDPIQLQAVDIIDQLVAVQIQQPVRVAQFMQTIQEEPVLV